MNFLVVDLLVPLTHLKWYWCKHIKLYWAVESPTCSFLKSMKNLWTDCQNKIIHWHCFRCPPEFSWGWYNGKSQTFGIVKWFDHFGFVQIKIQTMEVQSMIISEPPSSPILAHRFERLSQLPDLFFIESCEPTKFEEAFACVEFANWRLAVESKMKFHWKNRIWDLVELLKNQRSLPCRWVFRLKETSDTCREDFRLRWENRKEWAKSGMCRTCICTLENVYRKGGGG